MLVVTDKQPNNALNVHSKYEMHPDIKNAQIRDMFVLGLRKCHNVAGCGLAFPGSETLHDKA